MGSLNPPTPPDNPVDTMFTGFYFLGDNLGDSLNFHILYKKNLFFFLIDDILSKS